MSPKFSEMIKANNYQQPYNIILFSMICKYRCIEMLWEVNDIWLHANNMADGVIVEGAVARHWIFRSLHWIQCNPTWFSTTWIHFKMSVCLSKGIRNFLQSCHCNSWTSARKHVGLVYVYTIQTYICMHLWKKKNCTFIWD